MNKYIMLKDNEIIKKGDEFFSLYNCRWRIQTGWTGKLVIQLVLAGGDGTLVRRSVINKKVTKKVCVNWI